MQALFGREQQCGRLDDALGSARRGSSAVLVLDGEHGVGKTALLDYAQHAAPDFQVVRFDAVPGESTFGYAGLHRLLLPFLERRTTLPGPQRAALEVAFGLRDRAEPPDLFLLGLAALALLTRRRDARPLLLLVDDADCLDQESAATLAFVIRRLGADPLAAIFALSGPPAGPGTPLNGLPRLPVAGLPAAAALPLLASLAGAGVDPSVGARLVAETGGNPLALIELARELTAGQLTGQVPLLGLAPVGPSNDERYRRDIDALPARTRTLLAAAAAGGGDPELLWRAGALLGFDPGAAIPAEERRLITIHDQVRFRHPLIRSAAYHRLPLADRQRVHAALAVVTGELGRLDQRAWQLAASTGTPDEAVAAVLEEAAGREQLRGGWTAAAHLLARAGALSVDRPGRARRLLTAAQASCMAGTPAQAQTLLDEAAAYRGDPAHSGAVARTRARIARLRREPAAATVALLSAATALGPVDPRAARDALLEAVVQAEISDRLAPAGTSRVDVARAARSLPLPPGAAATAGDVLLDANTALALDGLRVAAPLLRRAIDVVRQTPAGSAELFQWLAAACAYATVLADDRALHELAWRLDTEARRQGAVIPLALALSHTGISELFAGYLREAERRFDQRAALDEVLGYEQSIGALLVAAWRGRADETRALADEVAGLAVRNGQGYLLVFVDYAHFQLLLGQGRYREAYLRLAGRVDDTSQLKFALADLIEAAVRCGERTAARRLLDRLAELAAACPVNRTLGDLARARGVLADEDPQRHFADAVEQHEQTRGPAHRARTHQAYGEWLRRSRQAKAARGHLRTAYDLFDGMGAAAFATRAGLELAAAGEKVPTRPADTRTAELTAQEARVTRLAAAGSTNAEIAAQLYLSPSTVDYHLRKVFRKLGVRTRRQLPGTRS